MKIALAVTTSLFGLALTGLGVYLLLGGQILALFYIVLPGTIILLLGIRLFFDGKVKDFIRDIFINLSI